MAIVKASDKIQLEQDRTVVSGIGCSSRALGYLNFNTVNSAHGRALPIARPKARGGSSKSEVLIYSIHYPKVTEADLILAMSRKFATIYSYGSLKLLQQKFVTLRNTADLWRRTRRSIIVRSKIQNNQANIVAQKTKFYQSLLFQVWVAIVAGIVVGYIYPSFGTSMKPLGDAFIKLIKMLIGPIIFCTIVTGIAGMGDMKKVGRVGMKALIYFEGITTFALFFGWAAVTLLQPGTGMNIDVSSLDADTVSVYTNAVKSQSSSNFFMNIIPITVVDAFAKGEILQILLFSLLFGGALSAMGQKGKFLFRVIDQVSNTLFGIVDIIMKGASIGVFGAIAFTIGKYGIASLGPLVKLLAVFYMTCIIFVFVVMGPVAKWAGFSLLKYIAYIKEELVIVLGTSSSESVLPRMMEKMENLGCSKSVVGLVIPTGYSFNLDGTSIYLTMAAIFLAQATNANLAAIEEITILAVLLVTSKGASGVTGAGFIVLAATLSTVPGIPVAALGVIFGIDRFLSMGRALTNLVGNGIATIVVSKWEHELDITQFQKVLGNGTSSLGQNIMH
ncbi:MAG: C4-dicarboxylate transport protein [Firmicutes bacterium]|nr:C4-dicarboxylate transport protein [Bacillota bacterium]